MMMMIETTSLEREQEAQRRWRLRPQYESFPVFDRLLTNEFRDPAENAQAQEKALAGLLRFAAEKVPYYKALFAELGVKPEGAGALATLRRLPALSKFDVQDHEKALCATALPRNHKVYSWFRSSGTTGRTTQVLHSNVSNLMFNYLAQRQYRWFRWDPMKTRAEIRTHSLLPSQPNGEKQPPGAACRHPVWRYAGRFFETGPQVGLCVTNPIDRQIAWLLETKPSYLTANAAALERLAWVAEKEDSAVSLSGVHSISEQMTDTMRQRIVRAFGATVDENYGLNEIGMVGVRCAAGRYHVHIEHCLVEILDEAGAPCPPGTVGRLVVTGLTNFAMPLLRYETGDLAAAVDGACLCGRSLPAFGELAGRYRRLAGLPDDTLNKILVLKFAVRDVPIDVGDRLREYQVRQRRDHSYELLLHVEDGPLPKEFNDWIQARWREQCGAEAPELRLLEVDGIPRSPSGKTMEFVSDFAPD